MRRALRLRFCSRSSSGDVLHLHPLRRDHCKEKVKAPGPTLRSAESHSTSVRFVCAEGRSFPPSPRALPQAGQAGAIGPPVRHSGPDLGPMASAWAPRARRDLDLDAVHRGVLLSRPYRLFPPAPPSVIVILGFDPRFRGGEPASSSRRVCPVDRPEGSPGSTWGDAPGRCEWIPALWSGSTPSATSAGMTGWRHWLGWMQDGDLRHESWGAAPDWDGAGPLARRCGASVRTSWRGASARYAIKPSKAEAPTEPRNDICIRRGSTGSAIVCFARFRMYSSSSPRTVRSSARQRCLAPCSTCRRPAQRMSRGCCRARISTVCVSVV